MQYKIWYIEINGQKEGPFSIEDLKNDRRITPDTKVWRQGFTSWVPIRKVPELKEVFEEENKPEIEETIVTEKPSDELVLDMGTQQPPIIFWLLIVIGIILFLFFQNAWN